MVTVMSARCSQFLLALPKTADRVSEALARIDAIRTSDERLHAEVVRYWLAKQKSIPDCGVRILIGQFVLFPERELGRGKMGRVCLGWQLELNTFVAVKLIEGDAGPADAFVRDSFRTESRVLAAMFHKNLVHVLASGVVPTGPKAGARYYVMRYLPDPVPNQSTPPEWRREPLTLSDAFVPEHRNLLPRLEQVPERVQVLAEVLHYVHTTGEVVHNDVKPENVLLNHTRPERDWFLTDFGVAARVGAPDPGGGTPEYRAPERADDQSARGRADPRSDLYSLGVMLFELLTGNRTGAGFRTAPREELDRRLAAVGVPRDLRCVCLKCLEHEPTRRYQTADALARDLGRYRQGRPVEANPVYWPGQLRRWAKRDPGGAAATAGFLLALFCALAYITYLYADRSAKNENLVKALGERDRTIGERDTAYQNLDVAYTDLGGATRTLGEVRESANAHSYVIRNAEAHQNYAQNRADRVRELLDGSRPHRPGDKDRRGFEWYYLDALSRYCLATCRGHEGNVWQVVYSPDGNTVATASNDKTVKLWKADTGELIRTLPDHGGSVRGVSFSPDGKYLACAVADKPLRIWRLADDKPFDFAPNGASGFGSVSFSPAGDYIAAASVTRAVLLWSVAFKGDEPSLELRDSLPARFGQRPRVAFSPDGTKLAFASYERRDPSAPFDPTAPQPTEPVAIVWDVSKRKIAQRLFGHWLAVTGLAFSPDGSTLATGSEDHTVRLWSLATGSERCPPLVGHASAVLTVAFSHDGKSVASGSNDRTIRLWDVTDLHDRYRPREGFTVRGHIEEVECVAFHPKRPRLASAGNHYEEDRFRGEAKLWDVTHAPEFRVLRNGGMVGGTVAFDPDGTRLAFGTSWSSLRPGGPPTDSHTVNVVDLTGAGPPLSGEGHTTFVRTFAFSSDKKTLLSLDQGGTVRVWDLTARPMTSTSLEKVAAGVSPLAIAPDGRSFAHAAADNTVIVRALANGNPLRTLSGHTGRVACLTFAPDGARLVTGSDDGTIRVWDLDAKASTVLVGHTKGVSGVALVPSGRLFSCSTDLTICEWDVTNAKQVRELGRHTQGTPHLSASADGRRLVSHDWYTIKVWDLETNLETVTLQQHSLINSVALAPDGKRLATLSGTEIRLWPGKP